MSNLPEGYDLREGADPVAAHDFLKDSYWAKGIALETVARSLEGSFPVSITHAGKQVAMARVISDFATFAFLTDVYVLEAHARKGLAQAMLAYLLAHPKFQGPKLEGIGRWLLFTKDAQTLYAKFGWFQYPMPDRTMVIDNRLAAS